MKDYNNNEPLISLHTPKCAGTSMVDVLRNWFGKSLLLHYIDPDTGQLPSVHRLRRRPGAGPWNKGICIHGHFSKLRGFGTWDYYPEVGQFITILRDPFEQAVSLYFYTRRHLGWRARRNPMLRELAAIPSYTVERYLNESRSRILDFFPIELSAWNYQEFLETYFVYIGIAEDLETSVTRLADKLGFAPVPVGRQNATERNEKIPEGARKRFIENHPLEYAVYNYALDHYKE